MSVAILHSRAERGTEAPLVTVEVFLSGGLPSFSIVGMAETAVRESKDRVRGALMSSGFQFPQQRITVNLGPADLPKHGGRFDLAIALGILAASRQIRSPLPAELEYFGELALDGGLRAVAALLPSALAAARDGRAVIVPRANAQDASLGGATTYRAATLLAVTAHLGGGEQLDRVVPDLAASPRSDRPDLRDVRGQQRARRALEIAAAGAHNLLLSGPPGTGKTLLAQRLPGLLPRMRHAEAIETAAVYSIAALSTRRGFFERPFRAPHHGASAAALVGGGRYPRPGEISLAHNGVLFLDEFPEFNRRVLESLREPMEAGRIDIARAGYRVRFPARFQLVAAMNPCPCGYAGDRESDCHCSADRIASYRGRLSGPLLDRIDLQVDVRRQAFHSIRRGDAQEDSDTVSTRVEAVRRLSEQRQQCPNAALPAPAIERSDAIGDAAWSLLETAAERLRLSARSAYRVMRVARTIADLAESESIVDAHVAEALSFRVPAEATPADSRTLAC